MAVENHRIAKYQYELIQDTVRDEAQEFMMLFLYDEQREMLCNIVFVPNNTRSLKAVPSRSGHINVQLPLSHFDRLLDMLRNEKPLYFSWMPGSQAIRISTNKEPVGEQEMRKMFSFLYI